MPSDLEVWLDWWAEGPHAPATAQRWAATESMHKQALLNKTVNDFRKSVLFHMYLEKDLRHHAKQP